MESDVNSIAVINTLTHKILLHFPERRILRLWKRERVLWSPRADSGIEHRNHCTPRHRVSTEENESLVSVCKATRAPWTEVAQKFLIDYLLVYSLVFWYTNNWVFLLISILDFKFLTRTFLYCNYSQKCWPQWNQTPWWFKRTSTG